MSKGSDLDEQIQAIVNAPGLTVVPVGEAAPQERGILQVAGAGFENLRKAVGRAFSAAVIGAALMAAPAAHAAGVGYDANVYGQAQGQVMQQGSATHAIVLNVRPVRIEVAPQERSGTGQAIDYAITGGAGAVGAIVGARAGHSQQAHQIGAIAGGLVGVLAGNAAVNSMNRSSQGQQIDGVELTLLNPVTNNTAVITQAGMQGFREGDRVLAIQMNGSWRVVPDNSPEALRGQPGAGVGMGQSSMQPGRQIGNGMDVNRTVNSVLRSADSLGIQVDSQRVARLVETGDAGRDGRFTGSVVAVDRALGLVYQSTGRGYGEVYAMSALSRVPEVNEVVSITMRNGRGSVDNAQSQARGYGRGM